MNVIQTIAGFGLSLLALSLQNRAIVKDVAEWQRNRTRNRAQNRSRYRNNKQINVKLKLRLELGIISGARSCAGAHVSIGLLSRICSRDSTTIWRSNNVAAVPAIDDRLVTMSMSKRQTNGFQNRSLMTISSDQNMIMSLLVSSKRERERWESLW